MKWMDSQWVAKGWRWFSNHLDALFSIFAGAATAQTKFAALFNRPLFPEAEFIDVEEIEGRSKETGEAELDILDRLYPRMKDREETKISANGDLTSARDFNEAAPDLKPKTGLCKTFDATGREIAQAQAQKPDTPQSTPESTLTQNAKV